MSDVLCAKCNEPIELGATSFSVCCAACGQWHLVERKDGAVSLKPYGDPGDQEQTAAASDSGQVVSKPAVENEEVMRLDMEWERERKRYLVFGPAGPIVPKVWVGVVALGIGIVTGGQILYQSGGRNLLGLVFIGVFGAFGFARWRSAIVYDEALQKYQRRRRIALAPAKKQ